MPDQAEAARRAYLASAGVLSDLDGTLIDSSAPSRRAWEAFARRHGLEPEMVISEAQGRPSRETVARLAPDADRREEARRLEAAEVGDTAGVRALSGAAEILAGPVPVVIVTSCSEALARARFSAAGLTMGSALISADDVTRGKPDPEAYRLGAARLAAAPADCVVLEDAPAGVRAGVAAGARVIALVQTHSAAALAAAGADWVLDRLGDLLPLS